MNPPVVHQSPADRWIGRASSLHHRNRWKYVLELARTYWCSADWKFAWTALALLIALQFGTASVFFYTNRWQQAFYNSVEQHQVARFHALILVFLLILAIQVLLQLIDPYLNMLVAIRWRKALTERYLGRWLADNRFAEIERLRLIDNPDQRISEDIASITGQSGAIGLLSLMLGLLSASASAIGFGIILMETAEPIRLSLSGWAISIPGSTIWYALIYAVLGSVIVARVGRPFVRATMERQHYEGNFRVHLVHARRNAAQIGFVGAAGSEKAALFQAFEHVRRNFRRVIVTTLGVNFVQHSYEVVRPVIPLLLLVPRYFAGKISFGQVMAGQQAFQSFASQISWFAQVYPALGAQIACLNRLKALDDAIDMRRPRGIEMCTLEEGGAITLTTRDLTVARPDGTTLLTIGDWAVHRGERWLIRGASGAGKTTLLRAMAGLWPDGRGTVSRRMDGLMMFVPQRLYLPLDTLKGALCFPQSPDARDDHEIAALLERVGLHRLVGQLHLSHVWQEELSPGEQQRIALVRILLQRPTLIVLDEATSALDPENTRVFHEIIRTDLPDATWISVAHDDALARFHSHELTIGNHNVAMKKIDPTES